MHRLNRQITLPSNFEAHSMRQSGMVGQYIDRAKKVAHGMQTGTVWINDYRLMSHIVGSAATNSRASVVIQTVSRGPGPARRWRSRVGRGLDATPW